MVSVTPVEAWSPPALSSIPSTQVWRKFSQDRRARKILSSFEDMMCVLLLSNKGLNIYGVSFFHFGRQEAQSKKMVTQLVKNLPAMRDTWIQSLGWEDPLGKGTSTHSHILA